MLNIHVHTALKYLHAKDYYNRNIYIHTHAYPFIACLYQTSIGIDLQEFAVMADFEEAR